MSTILEELKRYFQNTPQEKILSDWAETEKYDEVGPTVQEFRRVSKFFFTFEDYYPKEKEKCNILVDPKYNLRVSFF